MIGQTLSHYCSSEKLGAGGISEVYRAEDTNLDRQMAVNSLSDVFTHDRVGEEAISIAPEFVDR